MDYIQPYLNYFTAHPEWAIALVFLISLGEALLIIGLFVPSTAVLVGAGMLVGTGNLGFWPVFIATATGAIIGDQLSYWAGRLFGERLKSLWPLNRYPQLVARGEDYVRSHGGKSIAFGRFIPGVKAVVPGIVGMFGMNQVYFLVVNVTSGLFWTAAHVFPGILIGQGLALAGELSGRLVVVLLVLLVVLAVAGWIMRLLAAGTAPHRDRAMRHLSNWAKSQQSRSMHRFGRAVSPDNPRSQIIVLFFGVFILGLIALIDITSGLFLRTAVSNLDISVNNLLSELRNGPADSLMIAITMLGDTSVIMAVSAVMIGWLFWRRAWRAGFAALAMLVSGKLVEIAIKLLMHRERPPGAVIYHGWDAYSFPSGHTLMATLAFGILAVLVSHSMSRWSRALVVAGTGMVIIAIGFSRVYLGAHWLSDTLGGFLLGSVLVAMFGVVVEAIPPRRIGALGLLAASLLTFVIVGNIHLGMSHEKQMLRYAETDKTIETSLADWPSTGWKTVPTRRIDLAGRPEEVFVGQWIGRIGPLQAITEQHNWSTTTKWSWRDGIAYLDPHGKLATAPPRPALHEGLQAKLTAIITLAADQADYRVVLRAYKSNFTVRDANVVAPVYLLSLTREVLRPTLSLYAVPSTLPATAQDVADFLASVTTDPRLAVLGQNEVDGQPQAILLVKP